MQPIVFFDLDGTLTDPKLGITRCIQYALDKLGVTPPPADDLTWCIGPPLHASFVELVGPEQAATAVEYYRERFGTVGWAENTPYPGIRSVLGTIQAAQPKLYVATSKPHVYAQQILDHFDLSQYFVALFGAELDGTRSDKGDLLRFALEQTQAEANAIMVGDRKHDILGAKANALPAVGVSYGYGSQAELREAGATQIVHSPQELAPCLLNWQQ